MDSKKRLKYLQSMGIEVWLPRSQAFSPEIHVDPANVMLDSSLEQDSTHKSWQFLENSVSKCEKCQLCHTRTQTVFGSGNRNADWMFIGEAPGKNEDLEGKPFVGQAGLLLTEMIRAMGLDRENDVFIANILKCRPPNNRDPKSDEVEACSEYLLQQIDLVKPKMILAVGRIAAQSLLNTNDSLAKLRRTVHQISNIPLIVIYHPAYLLRSLSEKRKAWQDLLFAIEQFKK